MDSSLRNIRYCSDTTTRLRKRLYTCSIDRKRVKEARDALEWVLEELREVPLLVLRNKQDLPGALDYAELEGTLALKEVRGRQWRLQLCSTIKLEGLQEGLEWLSCVLTRKAGISL